MKKPKKQAGWLVDLNNEIKTKVKAKPPSGLSKPKDLLEPNKTEIPINEDSSEPNSVQDEIILTTEENEEEELEEPEMIVDEMIEDEDTTETTTTTTEDIMDYQKDVCLNYSSILKFIKQGTLMAFRCVYRILR